MIKRNSKMKDTLLLLVIAVVIMLLSVIPSEGGA